MSCHDCFRKNSLQRPAAATAKRVYLCLRLVQQHHGRRADGRHRRVCVRGAAEYEPRSVGAGGHVLLRPKLTTLGAGIAVLVFVMFFAIVITSTGATFGVLMTLFSFANCLGDIVLCIIPFFLRKKYPHACRHAGFTMPLWVLYAMSVFAIVVAARC